MVIGALLCEGGSAFFEAVRYLSESDRSHLFVVTDRECDAEKKIDSLGIPRERVNPGCDSKTRSIAIAEALRFANARSCIVAYDRLLQAELYEMVPCINIHPSFLPEFPGMKAVNRAVETKSQYIGCTAHLIDEGIDTGPILAQRRDANPGSLTEAEHLSFQQKAFLINGMIKLLLENPEPTKEWLILRCRDYEWGISPMAQGESNIPFAWL